MATLSQPMAALERANTIRLARADLRRKLSNRELTAGELLLDPPAAILTWEVGELLSAQWRWGNIRTRKFLGTMVISFHREVRMLTGRERRRLVEALER
jgi:hypothetical protein